MRWTGVLRRATAAAASGGVGFGVGVRAGSSSSSQAGSKRRNLKSLALSVHFKQPELGMTEYEILSRASAYLLGVDAPDPATADTTAREASSYGHLEAAERRREDRSHRATHGHSPAGGPAGRNVMDLGWLEFVPREVRPQVHVVCSSHVVSPFLWRDYYPQDWLSKVRQEHCAYSLEVYDPDAPEEALARLALHPEPFHHPEGRDLSLVHLQEEQSSLKLLRRLGVDVLHLRDPDKLYQKGEEMLFDGFVVSERNVADSEDFASDNDSNRTDSEPSSLSSEKEDGNVEDLRIFYPYKETGKLSFHTHDRFFATTPEPLPEGLCGAPVLDVDGDLCGTVEGIVPVDHKNDQLAGSAAFMPSFVMKAFIDYVERGLLQQMMPEDLFQMVVETKRTNTIGGGGVFRADGKGGPGDAEGFEKAYDAVLASLRKRCSPEDYETIMRTTERERDEVMEIFDNEGGQLDEIIHRVRQKTLQTQKLIQDQYRKERQQTEQEEDDGVGNNALEEKKG